MGVNTHCLEELAPESLAAHSWLFSNVTKLFFNTDLFEMRSTMFRQKNGKSGARDY
jgi:hypothetical protein